MNQSQTNADASPVSSGEESPARALVFGEVLFDHFPDGSKVLGGAPFNVAWNLRGIGNNPLFVSAVGQDVDGESVRERMRQWQIDLSGLQVCAALPTGSVKVDLIDGQPRFEIVADQAYDAILPPSLSSDESAFDIFYHGSLAFRSARTRATLIELMARHEMRRFVDINIRQPHFDRAWLGELLPGATWVKLNDDELAGLTGMPCDSATAIGSAVAELCDQFGSATYFITCGSRGAYAFDSGESIFAQAVKPTPFQDTVGAGDAFSAATIGGLLRRLPSQSILDAAVGLASRVCSITGATSSDESLYQEVF